VSSGDHVVGAKKRGGNTIGGSFGCGIS